MEKNFKLPPRMLFALDSQSPEEPRKETSFNFDDIPKIEANKMEGAEDGFFGFFLDSKAQEIDTKSDQPEIFDQSPSEESKELKAANTHPVALPSFVPPSPIKTPSYTPPKSIAISKATQKTNRPASAGSKMPIFKPMISFQKKSDNNNNNDKNLPNHSKRPSSSEIFPSVGSPPSELRQNASAEATKQVIKNEKQENGTQNRPPETPKVEAPKITVPQGHDELQTFFVDKTEQFHSSLSNMTNYLEEAKEQLKELTVKLYALNAESLFLVQPTSALKEKFQRCEKAMQMQS